MSPLQLSDKKFENKKEYQYILRVNQAKNKKMISENGIKKE